MHHYNHNGQADVYKDTGHGCHEAVSMEESQLPPTQTEPPHLTDGLLIPFSLHGPPNTMAEDFMEESQAIADPPAAQSIIFDWTLLSMGFLRRPLTHLRVLWEANARRLKME
ncbi:hypothetical protein CROQUDRAFT_93566 [Cronartium quercuum f. sp. fusiforme G11]|uniref:Uncharacterized protein n=1 Tax=Cronartium quercuum f. sp. fusiforme G11 TaxID=708437 RepID=A0A9P6NHI7_9BASI|nr:hypothetical protein CROQUDRAFT_93566 [Cronartium quercuum f. sp. fusiforme G11]